MLSEIRLYPSVPSMIIAPTGMTYITEPQSVCKQPASGSTDLLFSVYRTSPADAYNEQEPKSTKSWTA